MSTLTERPSSARAPSSAQPVPEGMRTVTPHLVCAGAADAIAFYQKAFGATEMFRLAGPDGRLLHACLKIGDSAVMLVDEFPEWNATSPKTLKGTPVTIHLYVENADAFAARAIEAGAKVLCPVQSMFWGDRYGVIQDPFGHHWSIATHERDVTPEELQKGAQEGCCGASA